jgi:hypothetical protein
MWYIINKLNLILFYELCFLFYCSAIQRYLRTYCDCRSRLSQIDLIMKWYINGNGSSAWVGVVNFWMKSLRIYSANKRQKVIGMRNWRTKSTRTKRYTLRNCPIEEVTWLHITARKFKAHSHHPSSQPAGCLGGPTRRKTTEDYRGRNWNMLSLVPTMGIVNI